MDVTFNVRDFPRVVGEWAAAGRHHAGCLVIVRIDPRGFGVILSVIEGALATRPEQAAWRNYTTWVSHGSARSKDAR